MNLEEPSTICKACDIDMRRLLYLHIIITNSSYSWVPQEGEMRLQMHSLHLLVIEIGFYVRTLHLLLFFTHCRE